MNLFDQINADIKSAMLAKEKDRLQALRAVKSAFLLAKTEKGATTELSDSDAIKIVQKQVKQRKESAEIQKSQGRDDLHQQEMNEASFIEIYLPAQMTKEDLTKALKEIIAKLGATSPQDMGKVMGFATKELSGKAEGKMIAQLVKELLVG